MSAADDAMTIALPAQLDASAAPALHRLLLEAVDVAGDIHLDGAAVEAVTTPCLQVLAAAAGSQRTRGGSLSLLSASPILRGAIQSLDLAALLPLPAAADAH